MIRAEAGHDMLSRARALTRIRRAARLVEYDLWRIWPIEDKKPGVIDDFMLWMIGLADDLLDADSPEDLLPELASHVLRSCAPFLDDHEELVIGLLLHDRVTKNRAIARALAVG